MAQRILLAWILSFSVSCSLAETRLCSPQEEEQAEYVAATATSWQELHQQFLRYGHCDDGAIAEGFSEAVTVLLAERWHTLKELYAMRRADPKFQDFVLRHINETVPAERLNLIARNAQERCPPGLTELCRDIEETTSTLAPEAYRLPKMLVGDCIGTLCIADKDDLRIRKINSILPHQVRDTARNNEGSYCFLDPRHRIGWRLQAFDLHEEQKGSEKMEYLMSVSVSAVQHCKRFAELPYPWRSLKTQRGIRLGSAASEVSARYGTPARRILAAQPKARTYVSEIVGNAEFKEAWIYFGTAPASLFSTIFVFDSNGKVIGFSVGNASG